MPAGERSLARSLLGGAWGDFLRRPSALLLLTASALPLVVHSEFIIPGTVAITSAAGTISMLMGLIGYSLCYSLLFLFWCAAVFIFGDARSAGGGRAMGEALRGISSLGATAPLSGLLLGLVGVFVTQFAHIAVAMLLSYAASGQESQASGVVLSYALVYLTYIVVDLVLVLFALMPQMIVLARGGKVEEVVRASYTAVRGRYRDAVMLLIVPELVLRTLFIAAMYAVSMLSGMYVIFAFALTMALLEGARTAFVAAAFNRFYYHLLEEEKKKPRAARKPSAGQAARKPAPRQVRRRKK